MKLPSKAKSSPGRTDDFPPPLIMFPRSKSTRGSSRSRANNTLFVRKINNVNNEPNQEPSSPKVTCIGQVRVNKKKKKTRSNSNSNNNKQTTSSSFAVRRCDFLRKIKPRWFRRVWRTRISFFRCDCCRKSEKLQKELQERTDDQIKREIGDVIGGCKDELILQSPPRNAFVLTRSRSAPHRYSSEDVKEEKREDEGSINGVEEFDLKFKPLNLSRCKSEPARRTEDDDDNKLFMSFSFSS